MEPVQQAPLSFYPGMEMDPTFCPIVVLTKIAQRLKSHFSSLQDCTFWFSSKTSKVHVLSYTVQPEEGATVCLM